MRAFAALIATTIISLVACSDPQHTPQRELTQAEMERLLEAKPNTIVAMNVENLGQEISGEENGTPMFPECAALLKFDRDLAEHCQTRLSKPVGFSEEIMTENGVLIRRHTIYLE